MTEPLPVNIIRPKWAAADWATWTFATTGTLLVAAWIVMLLTPTFTPWEPGYWQTVAAILTARIFQKSSDGRWWTFPTPQRKP